MATISQFDFSGKSVLLRVDFNVPIKDGKITDDTRIRAALPTIQHVLENGGRLIVVSHWGRPLKEMAKDATKKREDFSLNRIVGHLSELVGKKVVFVTDFLSEEGDNTLKNLQNGEIALLENIRFDKGEEKGDEVLAKALADLADVYINDAFGTAHRAHASTAIVANYFSAEHKMFGFLMNSEVSAAKKVLEGAEKPFTAIIGGAKVSDKILIIENLLEKATDIIIGGGMAYTFYKAQGGKIGNSLCEDDRLDTAKELLEKATAKGVAIHLPIDSVIADKFDNNAATQVKKSNEIPDGWMGLDIGEEAVRNFTDVILKSKTILWNGPMGVFEMEAFQNGTKNIATAVKDATKNGAYTLVGGGDSVAAVNKFGFANEVSYVSTGGGAMLEFFEGKKLPGIHAIEK